MKAKQMENTNTPASHPQDEISIIDIIKLLLNYKIFILLFTVAAVLVALVFSIITLLLPPEISPLPDVFKSEALALINQQKKGGISSILGSSDLGGLAGLAGISSGEMSYGELSIKLLKGKSILDQVAEIHQIAKRYKIEKNIVSGTREALAQHLTASFDKVTNTLAITYQDYSPEFARDVLNSFVELLDKRFATIGGNKNLAQKIMLEAKLADVKAEITRLEAEIAGFQIQYKTLTIENLATEQVTIIAKLRSELILKDMEIKTYTDFSKIEDPMLKRLKAERENLALLINEMESGFSQYQGVLPAQKDMPRIATEYVHMQRELLVQGKIYEILTQQYELIKLSLEGEEPVFQILEMADVPDKKAGPSRGLIVIIAAVASMFVGVLLSFSHNALKSFRKKLHTK